MIRFITFFATVFFVAVLLSCSEWQKGKRGTPLGDDLFILDADTFRLQHYSANDSMLFLCPINNSDITIVVKQRTDSLYYPFKGEYISPVYDTEDFVLVNHFYIYDLFNKKKYQLPFKSIYDHGEEIYYLGDWNEENIFSIPIYGFADVTSVGIYFTDGTLIPLCEDARALHIEQDGKIKIERRGLSITMDIDELHNYKSIEKTKEDVIDGDMEIIQERCEEPRPGLIPASLSVHIEVPRGNTKTDKVIKKYFFQAICDDIFRLLDYDSKRLYSLSSIKSGDIRSALAQAAKVWRKEVRKKFSACDLGSGFTGFYYPIDVYKVAETDNYVTYYYELDAGISPGHDHPLYYYLTYDKQRDVIVNANNTIKKGMIGTFKERVPKWVNQQYEIWCHDGELSAYPCDEVGGCYSTTEGELHFPLPHFSIVPDGVTISFHTDQIDCCSAGNHLILIPKEDIQDCLEYDYWKNDKVTQPLSYFIDKKENYYYGMTNYDEN